MNYIIVFLIAIIIFALLFCIGGSSKENDKENYLGYYPDSSWPYMWIDRGPLYTHSWLTGWPYYGYRRRWRRPYWRRPWYRRRWW